MRYFDNLKLGKKLFAIVLVATLVLVAGSAAVMDYIRQTMLAAKVEQLRTLTESAEGLATALQKKVARGEMTLEAAAAAFGQQASTLTYDGGQGYIFAYRMDGLTIASPVPAQIGTNRLDLLINGKTVIRDIRDAVRDHGVTTIRYDYTRPNETVAIPKLS